MMNVSTARPRIWITPDTLPALKARAIPSNDRYASLKQAADAPADWSNGLLNLALAYVITGNASYAQKALSLLLPSCADGLNAITPDSGYQARNALPAIACCFDWLYPVLTPAQKITLVTTAELWCDWIWPETMPSRKGAWAVTDAENNYFYGFLLTWMVGLSLSGDSAKAPGYIDNARSKWTNLVLPVLAGPAAGGVFNEGLGYGLESTKFILWNLLAHLSATGEDLIASTPWCHDAVSALIHLTNPARSEMAPFGDLAAGPIADRQRLVALMLSAHDARCVGWLDNIALKRVGQRLNAHGEWLWYPATVIPFPLKAGRKPAAGKRTNKGSAA